MELEQIVKLQVIFRTSGPSNARSQPEDEFDKLIREGGSSVVRKHAPNDSMANLDLHLRRIGPTGNFEASICHYCGKEFSRACDLGWLLPLYQTIVNSLSRMMFPTYVDYCFYLTLIDHNCVRLFYAHKATRGLLTDLTS